MKKIVIATVLVIMTMTLAVSAMAADTYTSDTIAVPTVTEVAAPVGYDNPADDTLLAPPIVAYTLDYLDDVALEKGYVIENHEGDAIRIYTRQEANSVIHVIIDSDLATACVHTDPDIPGAIMGVVVYADAEEGLVFSTMDIVELLFV